MGQHFSKTTTLKMGGDNKEIAAGVLNIHAQNSPVNISSYSSSVESMAEPDEAVMNRNHWSKLIQMYKKDLNWMQPFPWDPHVRFEPEDFYIPLTLDLYSRSGEVKKDELHDLEYLFCPVEKGGARAEHVLIRGDGGRGKSVLCQKIASNWGNTIHTFRALPCADFLPILFKLKSLDSSNDLGEVLFQLVHSVYSPDHEKSEEATKEILRSLGNKVVLILDGYDEIDEVTQSKVKSLLNLWSSTNDSVFSHASFIVTCRPTDDKEFLQLFEKQYYISKLTEDQMKGLVKAYHRNNRSDTDRFLRECSDLDLAGLPPLVIFILCWLRKQSVNATSNSEDIIWSCIQILARRCNAREGFGFSDEEINNFLCSFGGMCYTLKKTTISGWALRECCQAGFLFLLQMGILKQCREDIYEPIHKLFFDVLAKKFITKAQSLLEDSTETGILGSRSFFSDLGFHETSRGLSYFFNENRAPLGCFHAPSPSFLDSCSPTANFTFDNQGIKISAEDIVLVQSVHSCEIRLEYSDINGLVESMERKMYVNQDLSDLPRNSWNSAQQIDSAEVIFKFESKNDSSICNIKHVLDRALHSMKSRQFAFVILTATSPGNHIGIALLTYLKEFVRYSKSREETEKTETSLDEPQICIENPCEQRVEKTRIIIRSDRNVGYRISVFNEVNNEYNPVEL